LIRFHLKRLIADYQTQHRQRLTLDRLSEATGIHQSTLSKISGPVPYNTTTDNIDALCRFFECELSELVEYVDDDAAVAEVVPTSKAKSGDKGGRTRSRSRRVTKS
jgi:putative transcriptional regulator